MATLQKIADLPKIYTVRIKMKGDRLTRSKVLSYETVSPETDKRTQLWVYAYKNNWNIGNNNTENEVLQQLERHLTYEDLQNLTDVDIENKVRAFVRELAWTAPRGIHSVTIASPEVKYDLDVTPDDIRQIFLTGL